MYTDEKKDLLDKLGKSIKELDININHKYNKIFDYNLKIYRDRVWKKKEKIFTVEYIYENYIIGVWDIFFMYYFGSDNSLTRIERHFCTECHKEFIGKGHIKKTLCDSCYDIRQKNLLKKRVEKFREKAAIMLSCKMAIKANMNISMKEMEALIDDLRRCENPYTCPHGRPTTIFFSNYELEKMFKRAM